MKTAKRKYKKHTNDGKITIKPFLNTRLKGFALPDYKEGFDTDEVDLHYPIYIRVTVKRQSTSFPATIHPHAINSFSSKYYEEEFDRVRSNIEREIEIIYEIVESLKPFERDDFDIKEVSEKHHELLTPLPDAIAHKLINEIKNCLESDKTFELPFMGYSYDYDQEMMRLDQEKPYNYLSSIIDWQESTPYIIVKTLSKFIPSVKALMNKYPDSVWGFTEFYQGFYYAVKVDPSFLTPLLTIYDWDKNEFQSLVRKIMPHQLEEVEILIDGLNRLIKG